jgi:hypothetical protein
MMTLVAAAMLNMAAMKADPLDNARKALNNCMIEVHNDAVGEKMSPSAFIKTTESACPEQRAAYRAMLVKNELAMKSTRKDAEQFADEEVQILIDSVVTAFNDNVETGGKLAPEK